MLYERDVKVKNNINAFVLFCDVQYRELVILQNSFVLYMQMNLFGVRWN